MKPLALALAALFFVLAGSSTSPLLALALIIPAYLILFFQ